MRANESRHRTDAAASLAQLGAQVSSPGALARRGSYAIARVPQDTLCQSGTLAGGEARRLGRAY